MSTAVRVLIPCLFSFACLAVLLARLDWLSDIGVDVATLDRVQKATSVVGLEQSVKLRVSKMRCEAKSDVVTRLMAGELDLFEAAACFRDLNHEPPEFRSMGYLQLPGGSDEEKLCRQVIRWVENWDHGSSRAKEVGPLLAYLETELAFRLRRAGRIELPERN